MLACADYRFDEFNANRFVTGTDLLLCGNHVYSHYHDTKEVGTYLCGDTIVDVAALCPNNVSAAH